MSEGRLSDVNSVSSLVSVKSMSRDAILHRLYEHMLAKDPVGRRDKDNLCRAFTIWSQKHPLTQKCDELARQMQERMLTLNKLRDSYLRDVITVKYHIDKLAEYGDGQEMEAVEEMRECMPALAAVPSMDLRPLIERAKNSLHNKSSAQLKETMLQAGLIDAVSGKQLSPWEKGGSFGRMQTSLKGNMYDPHSGGATIDLHAPSSHKLHVNYCPDCIGVMQVVADWNSEVERGIYNLANADKRAAELDALKKSINSINDIVFKQETKIVELTECNRELQARNDWFEHFQHGIDAKATEMALNDKILLQKELRSMAAEDLLSEKWNKQYIHKRELQHENHIADRLREELESLQEKLVEEQAARAEVESNLAYTSDALAQEKTIVEKLENQLEHTNEKLRDVEKKCARAETSERDLSEALAAKEKEFQNFKALAESDASLLKDQLKQAAEEYELKEMEVDAVREQLQESRSQVAELTEQCAEPEGEELERLVSQTIDMLPRHVRRAVDLSILDQVESGKIELRDVNLPTLQAVGRLIRPRPRLKTAVWCVIFMIRFRESIDFPPDLEDEQSTSTRNSEGGDDESIDDREPIPSRGLKHNYKSMGVFGRRAEIKEFIALAEEGRMRENRLKSTVRETNVKWRREERKVVDLEAQLDLLQGEKMELEDERERLSHELTGEERAVAQLQEELADKTKSLTETEDALAESTTLSKRRLVTGALYKVNAQLQRDLAHRVVALVQDVRTTTTLLTSGSTSAKDRILPADALEDEKKAQRMAVLRKCWEEAVVDVDMLGKRIALDRPLVPRRIQYSGQTLDGNNNGGPGVITSAEMIDMYYDDLASIQRFEVAVETEIDRLVTRVGTLKQSHFTNSAAVAQLEAEKKEKDEKIAEYEANIIAGKYGVPKPKKKNFRDLWKKAASTVEQALHDATRERKREKKKAERRAKREKKRADKRNQELKDGVADISSAAHNPHHHHRRGEEAKGEATAFLERLQGHDDGGAVKTKKMRKSHLRKISEIGSVKSKPKETTEAASAPTVGGGLMAKLRALKAKEAAEAKEKEGAADASAETAASSTVSSKAAMSGTGGMLARIKAMKAKEDVEATAAEETAEDQNQAKPVDVVDATSTPAPAPAPALTSTPAPTTVENGPDVAESSAPAPPTSAPTPALTATPVQTAAISEEASEMVVGADATVLPTKSAATVVTSEMTQRELVPVHSSEPTEGASSPALEGPMAVPNAALGVIDAASKPGSRTTPAVEAEATPTEPEQKPQPQPQSELSTRGTGSQELPASTTVAEVPAQVSEGTEGSKQELEPRPEVRVPLAAIEEATTDTGVTTLDVTNMTHTHTSSNSTSNSTSTSKGDAVAPLGAGSAPAQTKTYSTVLSGVSADASETEKAAAAVRNIFGKKTFGGGGGGGGGFLKGVLALGKKQESESDSESDDDSEMSMDTAEVYDLCLEDDRAMIVAELNASWGEQLDIAKRIETRLDAELKVQIELLAKEKHDRSADIHVRDQDIHGLRAQVQQLSDDKAYTQRENSALRQAVQDGYRRKEEEIETLIRDKEHIEKNRRRNRGTQITCFTCEQRGHAPHALYHTDGDDMAPETVPSLDTAFGEEGVVLRAQPRNINQGRRETKSRMRQLFESARITLEAGAAAAVGGGVSADSFIDGAADGVVRSNIGYPGDTAQPHKRLKQPTPATTGAVRANRFSELKNIPPSSRERADVVTADAAQARVGVVHESTHAIATALSRTQSAGAGGVGARVRQEKLHKPQVQLRKAKKERVLVQTASYLQRTLLQDMAAVDAKRHPQLTANSSLEDFHIIPSVHAIDAASDADSFEPHRSGVK